VGLFGIVMKYVIGKFYRLQYRISVEGLDRIPREEGCVLICNHISSRDPLVVGTNIPFRISIMAKKELFSNPVSRFIMKEGGAFPIDRSGNDISAVKKALRILKAKEPLLIFPEGTRNFTTTPLKPRPGAALIAYKARVKIVPVMVDTSYKLFSPLRIKFYEPVDVFGMFEKTPTNDEMTEFTTRILTMIYGEMDLYRKSVDSRKKGAGIKRL
jgi:1-acyl-sn-glycerol-3-phosphate acyltransferase